MRWRSKQRRAWCRTRAGLRLHGTTHAQPLVMFETDELPVLGPPPGEVANVLDHQLPWTTMRRVYRLIGFCRTYGDERVDLACRRLLEAESTDLNVLRRMLERALETDTPAEPSNVIVATARFARDNTRYAARRDGEVRS